MGLALYMYLFLFLELYKVGIIISISPIRKLELRKLLILFKEYG